MAEEQRVPGGAGTPGDDDVQVKVSDRRRFTATGEPIYGGEERAPANRSLRLRPPGTQGRGHRPAAGRIDELTRTLAALINEGKRARQRMEREKERVLEAEPARLARVILEAADELERVLAASGATAGALSKGWLFTLASLQKKVSDLGAQRFNALGETFNPHLHEAVDVVPVEDAGQDERVVLEVRAGYRIGDRVLRPPASGWGGSPGPDVFAQLRNASRRPQEQGAVNGGIACAAPSSTESSPSP